MTNKQRHEISMKLNKARQIIVIMLMIVSGVWYVTKGREHETVSYISSSTADLNNIKENKNNSNINQVLTQSDKGFSNSDEVIADSDQSILNNQEISQSGQSIINSDQSTYNGVTNITNYESENETQLSTYEDNAKDSSNSDSNLINLNRATLEELDTLPGVGPATAQNIINYREQYGGFAAIEEIKNVKRIGDKTFEKLKDHITV